jgi:hypothetical protein
MSFGVHKHEKRPIEIVSEKTQHRGKDDQCLGVAFHSGKANLRYGRYRRSKEPTRVKTAEFLWSCSTATLSFFC